jgi:hypothetical protein
MIRIRGVVYKDCDDALDAQQAEVDAEAEAKRAASGISPEQLSLQDALMNGQRAGLMCHGESMNPYPHGSEEAREWTRGRLAAIGASLPRKVA